MARAASRASAGGQSRGSCAMNLLVELDQAELDATEPILSSQGKLCMGWHGRWNSWNLYSYPRFDESNLEITAMAGS